MTPFDSAAFPGCLAVAGEDHLLIGTIDAVQKLHIRPVPLGEQPRRICHCDAARAFAVLTTSQGEGAEEAESHHVRLLDDQTFERLGSEALQPTEAACSLACVTLEGEGGPSFVVVGTAYMRADEPEPTSGRLLVFELQERAFEARHELRTKGAVYSLEGLGGAHGGKLLAGVNNKLQLYEWSPLSGAASRGLQLRHEHCGHILVLYIHVRGEFILVGDLMKSMTVLQLKTNELVELSRDLNANWMTAVSFLDDDVYLGAENALNLFTARKNADAPTDDERARLEVVGEFHLGEFVNRFRKGSLTMQVTEGGAAPLPTLLYGSVNGVLGVIASLPQSQYAFLHKVQAALAKVIKGVGGLPHAQWRSFTNERKTTEATGFIDGDLVEGFLELPPEKKAEVVAGLDVSVEELTQRVVELTRLH